MRSCKDDWHDEHFANQSASHERHLQQIRDMMDMSVVEQEYHDYMNRVHDAGFGCDSDAYESHWDRLFRYYEKLSNETFEQRIDV
jgi:glutathionyl-hydroquinone reductase